MVSLLRRSDSYRGAAFDHHDLLPWAHFLPTAPFRLIFMHFEFAQKPVVF